MEPNYPNPFNASTDIRYALPRESRIELVIYDLLGRRVRMVADGTQRAGWHTARWDGRDDEGYSVASGCYLYRLQAGTFSESKTMTLVK